MISSAQVALWSIGYVLDALNPKEKKELSKWRSLSEHNESTFQELISPEFRKVSFEEYLKKNNLTAEEYWGPSSYKKKRKATKISAHTSSNKTPSSF